MDLQALTDLFATTYNSDPNVRKAGELQIRKIAGQEGIVPALLQIVATDGVNVATRQACSVWLKNRVQKAYFDEGDDLGKAKEDRIPKGDREAIKSNLLSLIVASPTRTISVQLATMLRIVIQRDYPERWPGLLEMIKQLLNSGDARQVGAGCVAALECVKAFRFTHTKNHLQVVVEQLFPSLVAIGNEILSAQPSTSPEVPVMLHLILKTYKNSITAYLSAHQRSQESLVPWGRLCFTVVQLSVPLEMVPADEEDREKCDWWKAKKWAYSILCKLFHRYGNPSQLPTPLKAEYTEFAQHFLAHYAPAIFKAFLQQTEGYMTGQLWLSKKVQYHLFTFFTECIKPASTWALLKPHYHNLVSAFVYPKLCFTQERKELWDSDPIEYLRLTIDEYDNYATPVVGATSFLYALTTNRTKTTFLPILAFIQNVLQSNAAPPQRFGALNMAAALAPLMMRHPDVKDKMEIFLKQSVVPELSSGEPYMKAIALEMLGTVEKAKMQWSDEEFALALYRAALVAIDHEHLIVRAHALLTLTEMVSNHEKVKTDLSPMVGKIVQDMLKLCDDTELDILNNCMDTFVQSFQEELLPVAAHLVARLSQSYMRLVQEMPGSDDTMDGQNVDIDSVLDANDEGDRAFAAMSLAKTIGTVIESLDSSPEILAEVAEVIVQPIKYTLERKILDLLDNMYELIDSITYRLRHVPASMWPIFELTYALFESDAISWLDDMLPSLDNFLSYGSDVLKQRPDYRQMLLKIYTTAMTSESLGESDRVSGCKLAESILLNLRGHFDEALQTVVVTALDHMDKASTSALRLANLEVLINAVMYNTTASLHIMESHAKGAARVFFDQWFAAINTEDKLPRVHDKKLSILALCALMEMDPTAVPDSLKDGWHGIVAGALKIFKDLPKAIEKRQALEEEAAQAVDEESSEDDILASFNMEETDGDVWDKDSAYLELLAQEGERLRNKSDKIAKGEEIEDDESESDDEIEEEMGYISVLDAIDPYIAFKQALTTFQMKNAPGYQMATTTLDVEQQTFLMELMRMADERVAAAAAA